MKLIGLKCSNCGAKLEAKEDDKQIKCQYCNATTIIDDEIIKIEHKIINDDIDRKLTNASTYLYKLEKYIEAKKAYLELSKIIPDNPSVWKGIVLSETEHFNKINNNNQVDMELVYDAFKSYKALETDEDIFNKFQNDFDDYIKESTKENKKITQEKEDPIGAIIFVIMFIFFISVLISMFL